MYPAPCNNKLDVHYIPIPIPQGFNKGKRGRHRVYRLVLFTTQTQKTLFVIFNLKEGRPFSDLQLQRLSFSKGCLPPKLVFHQRLSITEGCLPLEVIFHQKSSSTEGYLPPKVIF